MVHPGTQDRPVFAPESATREAVRHALAILLMVRAGGVLRKSILDAAIGLLEVEIAKASLAGGDE